jgi:hypothetical protein
LPSKSSGSTQELPTQNHHHQNHCQNHCQDHHQDCLHDYCQDYPTQEHLWGHSDFQDYDILDCHCSTNRAPRPPSQQQLLSVIQKNKHSSKAKPAQQEEFSEDTHSDVHPSSRLLSKANDGTKLSFWPSLWTSFINQAKLEWRIYLAVTDAYPQCSEAIKGLIPEIVVQCIVAHKEDGRKLESGYYPRYKEDLYILESFHLYVLQNTEEFIFRFSMIHLHSDLS